MTGMVLLPLFLMALVVCAMVLIVVETIRCGISPMPSSGKMRNAMVKLLKENASNSAVIYELGSGWGGLALAVARALPAARVTAFERSIIPFCWSNVIFRLLRMKNIAIKRNDIYSISLSDADAVLCYLFPGAMAKLAGKVQMEMKPGAIIISSTFALAGWKPIQTILLNDLFRTPVYLYRKK